MRICFSEQHDFYELFIRLDKNRFMYQGTKLFLNFIFVRNKGKINFIPGQIMLGSN